MALHSASKLLGFNQLSWQSTANVAKFHNWQHKKLIAELEKIFQKYFTALLQNVLKILAKLETMKIFLKNFVLSKYSMIIIQKLFKYNKYLLIFLLVPHNLEQLLYFSFANSNCCCKKFSQTLR